MMWEVLWKYLDIRGEVFQIFWHHLTIKHVPGPARLTRDDHIIMIQWPNSV